MRLIDADTYIAYCDEKWIPLNVDAVNGQPTIEADRPQGEWIKAKGMMPPEFHGHHCCSRCGHLANMCPPFGNREDLSDFCPNCGAKMFEDELDNPDAE